MRRIGLVGVAAAAVLLLGACDGVDDTAADGKPGGSASSAGKDDGAKAADEARTPEDDVELVKCGVDEFGQFPQAELKVTNHSSKDSNYVISVEFLDGSGTRKAEGTAALNNLAPKQTAEEKAVGLSKAPSDLKCKITDVKRYASF
jgi:hypothetical protein